MALYRTLVVVLGLGQCMFVSPPLNAQTRVEVQTIVKDRTSQRPVTAVIYSRDNCPIYADSCVAVGMHEARRSPIRLMCIQGTRLFARILVQGYYFESTSASCFQTDDPIELLAAQYQDPDWLIKKADDLVQRGRPQEATVLLSQANQLRPSQAKFEQTLRAAALALNVKPELALTYDPLQKRRVASPTLVDAVKEFQRRSGLSGDGVLGTQTLTKLVGDRSPSGLILDFATGKQGPEAK